MATREWIVVPAMSSGDTADPRPVQFAMDGEAFLVHHEGMIYAAVADRTVADMLAGRDDCRRLSEAEARAFESGLPFAIPELLFSDELSPPVSERIGLGNVVAAVTRWLGIATCEACSRRRRILNRIVVWRWWRPAA